MANLDLSHLSDKDFSSLPEQDLAKIASSNKYKSEDDLLGDLSPDALNIIAGKKSPVASIKNAMDESNKMSNLDAFKIQTEKSATFGARPLVAGAGAGIGAFLGTPGGLAEKFKAMPGAYSEGRQGAVDEQNKAYKDRPAASLAGDIGGMALTLPLAPVTGLKGAMALGGAQSAISSVGEGKGLKDVVMDTAKGGAIGGASYGAVKAVAKGAELIAPSLRKATDNVTSFISDKTKSGLSKVGSALTGETEKNIETFATKMDDVNKIIKDSGGDIGVAADNVRTQLSKQIQSFRQSQGAKIGEALDNVSKDKIVPINDIVGALGKVKERINLKLKPEDAGQIDELMQRVSSLADDSGNISLKELHQVQDFLSDRAKAAYLKGGQMFVPGKTSQIAAKNAAREAKIILDKSVPELREANSKLFQLHKIEENINKNLIAPGKSESALLAAGGATSGRNRLYLKSLGDILGKDVVGEAEKLSAAAAFSNPNFLAKSASGTTSTSRTLVGGAIGSLFGGPGIGTAVGAAITSPAVLKKAIQTGAIGKNVIDAVVGKGVQLTDDVLDKAVKYLNTPEGISIFNRLMNQESQASGPMTRRLQVLGNKNQEQN